MAPKDDTFACPNGPGIGSMSNGFAQYKEVTASPGRCRRIIDEEAMKWQADHEKARRDLVWAARSRPLTDDEMAQLERSGYSIMVQPGRSFREEEVMREFNDLLLQQYRIRQAAASTGAR
jgi:hypothetical protein